MTQEVRRFTLQLNTGMTDEEVLAEYRLQLENLPEHRSFTIEVDESMSPEAVVAFAENVKREIHKKRVANLMDIGYDPLQILEDYFFPSNK